MKALELIKELSLNPNAEVEASVDIGTSAEPFKRAFGVDLDSIQVEPTGAVTLLFTDGCLNDDIGS